jgi:sugar diacid utilization regulator
VICVGELPKAATSAQTLARSVTRELARSRVTSRASIISGRPAIIAEYSERLIQILDAMGSGAVGVGSILCFGVGEPVQPENVHTSWEQAKEALLLRSLATSDRKVARFRDLGLLHLLALIPESEVVNFADYAGIEALVHQGSHPTDLELLEAFCETGSLRSAAAAVFLHFTTVRSRLNRIGLELKLNLNDPSDRLRAHVAVKLVQVHRARAIENSLSQAAALQALSKEAIGGPDFQEVSRFA